MIRQQTLFRLLITPSFASGFFVFLITVAILGYSGWLFLQGDFVFYDYLFGAYGLHTFIWQQSLGISAWYQAFLASPQAYYLLVVGAALGVGFAVFTILQGIGILKSGTREFMSEVGSNEPGRRHAGQELFLRFLLRVISLIGWGVFASFFVSSIIPFAIVLNQIGFRQWAEGGHAVVGACVSLAAAIVFILALHVQVVFARLSFLRPRLFHASKVIEEAEAAKPSV